MKSDIIERPLYCSSFIPNFLLVLVSNCHPCYSYKTGKLPLPVSIFLDYSRIRIKYVSSLKKDIHENTCVVW